LFGTVAAVGLTLVPATPRLIAFQPGDTTSHLAQNSLAIQDAAFPRRLGALPVRMDSSVIPAAFKPSLNRRAGHRNKPQVATPNVAPKVVLAKARQTRPSEVFLVVRTAEYDGMGRALLSVTVWRVSLNPKTMPTEQNGVLPKAI
jgi:hypothetical protein